MENIGSTGLDVIWCPVSGTGAVFFAGVCLTMVVFFGGCSRSGGPGCRRIRFPGGITVCCGWDSTHGSGTGCGDGSCSWNISHNQLHVDHILLFYIVSLDRPLTVVINV